MSTSINTKKHFYFAATAMLLGTFITSPIAYANTRYEMGVSTSASLLWMNDHDLNARLSDIKSLGTTWIRVDFSWADIQPDNPQSYDWEKYDRVVDAAGAHKLKILALIGYTPKWARDSKCQAIARNEKAAQTCSPRNSDEFGQFAHAAAMRYRQYSVRGWEIWNEPNLVAYWKTVQGDGKVFVDPVAYAKVANAVATEISRYSDAAIVTGGLSPLFEPSSARGMRQSNYLARLLPHLDQDLFDGVSIHPYSWPVLPNRAAEFNAFYTVDDGRPKYNLRTVMTASGWGGKQVWGTEYGASTIGRVNASASVRSRPDHVSEDVQAQIISEGINSWYIKQNVGPLFIHADSDQWLATQKNEGGFGLRRSDGTKKPAYDSLRSATESMKLLTPSR